jgi:hypothetical protein
VLQENCSDPPYCIARKRGRIPHQYRSLFPTPFALLAFREAFNALTRNEKFQALRGLPSLEKILRGA